MQYIIGLIVIIFLIVLAVYLGSWILVGILWLLAFILKYLSIPVGIIIIVGLFTGTFRKTVPLKQEVKVEKIGARKRRRMKKEQSRVAVEEQKERPIDNLKQKPEVLWVPIILTVCITLGLYFISAPMFNWSHGIKSWVNGDAERAKKANESVALYTQGVESLNSKDYDKAQQLFKQSLDKDENNNNAKEKLAETLYQSAKVKFSSNDLDGAKEEINKALDFNSSSQPAKELLSQIDSCLDEIKKEKEAKEQAEVEARRNEIWTKENIVRKLNEANVLNNKGEFCDRGDGSKAYQDDIKSSVKNPFVLNLAITSKEGIRITDKEICSDIVFNIAKQLYEHKDRTSFKISRVFIHFYNTDSKSLTTLSDWDNFDIGINVINNYFKEPRSKMTGISATTGEVSKREFDSESFYDWIEDHFTLPEDNSVLAEDTSWTTTSKRGSLKN